MPTLNTKILRGRGAYELRVIAQLSGVWPFQVQYGKENDEVDMFEVAARGVDTMKRKHPDLWEGMKEVNMEPKAVANIMVSVMLDDSSFKKSAKDLAARVAFRHISAAVQFPDVVTKVVDYFKTGPFKADLQVKSARGSKLVLNVTKLNSMVKHVEIQDLDKDKAYYIIHMQNGDSGWAWDEWRRPPKFNNDAKFNVLHLDRLSLDDAVFKDQMDGFGKTLTKAIQSAGWVVAQDSSGKKKIQTIEDWEKEQAAQKGKEQAQKAKSTPAPGFLYSQDTLDEIYSSVRSVVKRHDRGASGFSSEMEGPYLSVAFRLEDYDRDWDDEDGPQTDGLEKKLQKSLSSYSPELEEDEKGWYRVLVKVKA